MQFSVKKIITQYLTVLIMFTILSQMGEEGSFFRICMYVGWGLLATVGIFMIGRKQLSTFSLHFIAAYLIYFSYCSIMSLYNNDFLSGSYIHLMIIPAMVTIVADCYRTYLDKYSLEKILKIFVLASVFLGLWAHISFFSSYTEWVNSKVYLYASKNSAAQIWGTSILIVAFYFRYALKTERLFWYAISLYLMIIMMLSQARTAMLGLLVIGGFYFFNHVKNKIFFLFVGYVGVLVALNTDSAISFFSQVFLINKYDISDINSFSSGRIMLYKHALDSISDNLLFGVGKWYVDCSYISVFAESGLIGFVIIESIWLHRIVTNINSHNVFLSCLTIFYFIESCLEGYPPFGPGVSSFMFWMISELLAFRSNKKDIGSD